MKTISPQDIRELRPDFSHLEEAPIADSAGKVRGWHATAVTDFGGVLGSGCHSVRSIARRIAVAETIERALVCHLKKLSLSETFALNSYPSTCGFAAGFESESTRLRSICEAVERWCWSMWIDGGLPIPEIQFDPDVLSGLGRNFYDQFERIRVFSHIVSVNIPHGGERELKLGIMIGVSDGGIFPGSRVCSLLETPWDHAIVEAWRHRLIFQNQRFSDVKDDLVSGRIAFFGAKGSEGLSQVPSGPLQPWPQARIALSKQLDLPDQPYVLWRSLCADYRGWHEGTQARFVY